MSIRSDHKALLFLAAIAGLGATVRVARAVSATAPAHQPALDHQMQAADSAKRSLAAKRPAKGGRASSRGQEGRVASIGGQGPAAQAGQTPSHRDYRGRLDLDVATAAEIDSMPGIGPTLAKRIVADRMANGAFRELVVLQRVKGITPKVLVRLDSAVTFSGTYKPPQAADTILSTEKPRKKK